MRFVIPEAMLEIPFVENQAYELIIENPSLFTGIVDNISSQVNATGEEKRVILSENSKEISLSKCCELVVNPLDIDFNNRKIVATLHQEIKDIAQTQMMEKTAELNGLIIEYLDAILQHMTYDMDYSYEIDMIGLAKAFRIGIKDDSVSLAEKLTNYIKVQKTILNTDIIVFVNIKHFLTSEDYKELIKTALYEKIIVLNIAGNENYCIPAEKRYIIDNDLCLINMN